MATRKNTYNQVALCVIMSGTIQEGVTAEEVCNKLKHIVSRSSVYRTLREPGFKVALKPIHPRGYYFDPAEAKQDVVTRQSEPITKVTSRFKYLPGKFRNETPLGLMESVETTVNGESKPTLKEAIRAYNIVLDAAVGRLTQEDLREAFPKLKEAVKAFQTEGKKLDPKVMKNFHEALKKYQGVGLALLEITEFIMSDPALETPEWWTYFTD